MNKDHAQKLTEQVLKIREQERKIVFNWEALNLVLSPSNFEEKVDEIWWEMSIRV